MDISPTGEGASLWRTCRAIANYRRLNLFETLIGYPGLTVSDLAEKLDYSLSLTSQYLRLLNARGLLQAQRGGGHLTYVVAPDPMIKFAPDLVQALLQSFKREKDPKLFVFRQATAFGHIRRLRLVRILRHGPMPKAAIRTAADMPRKCFNLHFEKLLDRGYLLRNGNLYTLAKPRKPLPRVLVKWAVKSRA